MWKSVKDASNIVTSTATTIFFVAISAVGVCFVNPKRIGNEDFFSSLSSHSILYVEYHRIWFIWTHH